MSEPNKGQSRTIAALRERIAELENDLAMMKSAWMATPQQLEYLRRHTFGTAMHGVSNGIGSAMCARCGKPVPHAIPVGVVYCSIECAD